MPNACIGWTCFHNAPPELIYRRAFGADGERQGESNTALAIRTANELNNYFLDSIFTGEPETNTAWEATKESVPECSSMDSWEEASANNPDFGIMANWLPHPERATLQDVINAINDSLGTIPEIRFQAGDSPINPPGGRISPRRLKTIFKGRKPRMHKLY
jgi:hypothetical protein